MSYDVGIIGAGYVGLPLSTTFAEAGCRVLLVDVVEPIVAALNRGESHIADVESERLKPLVDQGLTGKGVPTGEFILGYPNHYRIIAPTPVVDADLDGAAMLPPLENPAFYGFAAP